MKTVCLSLGCQLYFKFTFFLILNIFQASPHVKYNVLSFFKLRSPQPQVLSRAWKAHKDPKIIGLKLFIKVLVLNLAILNLNYSVLCLYMRCASKTPKSQEDSLPIQTWNPSHLQPNDWKSCTRLNKSLHNDTIQISLKIQNQSKNYIQYKFY